MRKRLLSTIALLLAAAVGFVGYGCAGASSALSIRQTPPPPPPLSKTLAVENGDFRTISIFKLPITDTSAPTATISYTGTYPPLGQFAFDATGRLYVAHGLQIDVYAPPITNGAQPAFALPISRPTTRVVSIAFDRAGDLLYGGGYDGRPSINVVTGSSRQTHSRPQLPCVTCYSTVTIGEVIAPISSSSTTNFSINEGTYHVPGCCGSVPLYEIAFDETGNLWASVTSKLDEYAPPFSGSMVPDTSFSFGAVNAVAFDSTSNLYMSRFDGLGLDVYQPPFNASMTKAFTIGAPSSFGTAAFDTAGNLYVASSSGLLVFSPPFSSASTPVVTLPGTFGNVALGP